MYTFAAAFAATPRYTAEAVIEPVAGVAGQSARLVVQATLSPSDAASERRVVSSAGRFALSAQLSAEALACYSDTILRDDFDGDGF